MRATREDIMNLMRERILILDGATGTYLQGLNLTEEDFRGERFKEHPVPLKGCNDVLCLTKPEAIIGMHRAYIEAGADIIETNSFNCNCFSLADYGLEDMVYEISRAAAECAREATDPSPYPPKGREKVSPLGRFRGGRFTFIAGSMGPTNRTASMSGDVNNPAQRSVTFKQLYDTYHEQARGLMDGGADVLLVETIFDTLNAKAALKAITDLSAERGEDIPIMVSGTLSDASGRTLSGQTVEAFCASLTHANLLSIGLNCGFGAKQLLPWLRRLAEVAPCPVSVHPNAGLPNVMGGYDETPETFAAVAKQVFEEGLVNIYGGCCGTTPEHIRSLAQCAARSSQFTVHSSQLLAKAHQAKAVTGLRAEPSCFASVAPVVRPVTSGQGSEHSYSPKLIKLKQSPLLRREEELPMPIILSGLEPLVVGAPYNTNNTPPLHGEGQGERLFINIGERTNVAGSAKFRKLIQAKDYEAALSVARQQVEKGAQVIDICMDDGLIDGVEAMTTFLNLIASEPEIARVPVMIDSSKWEILKAGLQCVQGKSIVNSISLKEGEEKFLEKARYIHSMGAATVVMLFDEEGQADSYERKVSVARRAYGLLRGIGFPTEDIIFDPNVLAVATGMPEHDDYGRAFIAACKTIHEEMPEVHLSGGISNLSFSFRGNNRIRQAMHSVMLHHAMKVGLDMSIVNPAMTIPYEDIPQEMLQLVEAVVLNLPPTPSQGGGVPPRQETLNNAEIGHHCKTESPLPSEGQGEVPSPSERLIEYAEKVKAEEDAKKAESLPLREVGRVQSPKSVKERIEAAIMRGITDGIEADTEEAYREAGTALGVIDNYLMPAMEKVGKLFGDGKMFLPQVVKSARVMKKAVSVLEPYMKSPDPTPSVEEGETSQPPADTTNDCLSNRKNNENPVIAPSPPRGGQGEGLVVMATVKGDVHDIGKNIVSVVTQCNGYDVRDLGVMVDCDAIVNAAQKEHAVAIGLSGLITPSLDEMIRVLRELRHRGMTTPVIVGGATTSTLHTAVKMAPEYPDGIVIHSPSAADNVTIIRHLMADDREEYIAELKSQQRIIRENYLSKEARKELLSLEEAQRRRHVKRPEEVAVPSPEARKPLHTDNHSLLHPKGGCLCCDPLVPLINWQFFFSAWGLKGHFPELLDDKEKGAEARKLWHDAQQLLDKIVRLRLLRLQMKAQILPAHSEGDDIIITADDGKQYRLPMRRSLKDEPETHCLADYVMNSSQNKGERNKGEGLQQTNLIPSSVHPYSSSPNDYLCPFIVSAGVGLAELQESFRSEGDEYHAILAKLLADRLTEAMAEKLSQDLIKTLHWGTSNIRMAFGYGACPDHSLKQQVFDILGVGEGMGLTLTETNMINPGESICGLIFANTPTKYFNV